MEYAYFDGRFIPITDAVISVKNKTFNYGLGALEGIRGYWNQEDQNLYLFRLEDHFQRLLNSCKVLFITIPYTVKELCEITVELMKKNNVKRDIYIRPIAFINLPSLRPNLYKTEYGLTIFIEEVGYVEKPTVNAMISSWLRIDNSTIPPTVKSIAGYLNSALAYSQAVAQGQDEAIFVTREGNISEASTNNIFIVKQGDIITPPLSDSILEGITRNTIMQIAKQVNGHNVKVRSIPKSEIYFAEEVFMTGTAVEVLPVSAIDKRQIGNGNSGPITSMLQKKYLQIVRGEDKKYESFLTAVYP
ncbi:branched-chain amino acid transaminase [Sutcliffiella rhizosphaerae]|uniref:Branched-chain-amino-acid aminotransferase n=1 Tax=Sutcliffiella rhizosphaerae TaxID=2880967 RepID=A0ABM8YN99_9BACI|nr:branched-chain amino acid transaminase [Sutcliffiella rhizosphaerae]CAG9621338.1 Branched-chain-amino-acid aminotransferase [Sutcliffiella rhizosphaerae]